MKKNHSQGRSFSMEGWVNAGKINFLGWTSRGKIKNTETEFHFETDHSISPKITNEAQNLIRNLLLSSKLQKGWFYIEFLIDFKKEYIVMTNVNVGRDGGGMF